MEGVVKNRSEKVKTVLRKIVYEIAIQEVSYESKPVYIYHENYIIMIRVFY